MSEDKKPEHWSRHPAFLLVLGTALANAGAIAAAIKYATVENIPLFILIWIIGAILSFIAGVALPLYILMGLISLLIGKPTKKGYFKFLISTYWNTPKFIYQLIQDARYDKKQPVSTQNIDEILEGIKSKQTQQK